MIEEFLNEMKSKGCSYPENWTDFEAFLKKHKKDEQPNPPVPLILAASVESAAHKHQRIKEQIAWAAEAGIEKEAMEELKSYGEDSWGKCTEENWYTIFAG